MSCHVVTILKTREEMDEDSRRIMRGEEPTTTSRNEVQDTPPQFRDWLKSNAERIKRAEKRGTLPYFIKDNTEAAGIANAKPRRTPQEIAKERHAKRTPERERELREFAARHAFATGTDELARAMGIHPVAPMSHEQADHESPNPNYNKSNGYRVNCQTCVVAYEMRLRGLDVEALANTRGSAPEKLSYKVREAWRTADGNEIREELIGAGKMTKEWNGERMIYTTPSYRMTRELKRRVTEPGRYHLYWAWKGRSTGHIITMERTTKGLTFYDPQNGRAIADIEAYLAGRLRVSEGLKYYRVDNAVPNIAVQRQVLTKAGGTAKAGSAARGGTGGNMANFARTREVGKSERFATTLHVAQCSNLRTGFVKKTRSARKNIIHHAFTQEAMDAAEYAWDNPQLLKFVRTSELGEGKSLNKAKDIANVEKKRKRGVVRYNIYEIEHNGATWEVGLEETNNGHEQFYYIKNGSR